MPDPTLIYRNSRFFENLLEHRFLFDLGRHLVLAEQPQFLNVLKYEIDSFGIDLVLSVADRSVQAQMKTRSRALTNNPYQLSEGLWRLPNACVIWILYSQSNLEPLSYYLLGFPMPSIEHFKQSKRQGYVVARMRQANYPKLSLAQLAGILFPTTTH
jgi:hypothetical protein